MFAETTEKNLRRSTNGGASFSGIVSGVGQVTEPSANFLFIAPFRHDPSNRDRIWYGGHFPWRSNNASTAATDAAVTWTQAGTLTPGNGSISAWAIDPNNGNNVWAGLVDGKVIRTNQGTTSTSATNWFNVSPGFSGSAYISWVELDANDASGNTAYVTNSRVGSEHVFRTANAGAAWADITNNLPDIPVHCLVVQPGVAADLFVGTDLGIFVSKDTGATWASANNPGFANVVVESLEFQTATTLYAFTHGRGAFRATVSTGTLDLAVTPPTRSVGSPAGSTTYSVSLSGAGSTTWTATTTAPWITSINPSSGTATQVITVNYSANSSTLARSANITVTAPGASNSPTTVSLGQAGVLAQLSVLPSQRSVGGGAGSTTFAVTNTLGGVMTWTAAASPASPWLTIQLGASGTNSGTITVGHTGNTTGASRSGTLTVTATGALGSPATVTVNQACAAPAAPTGVSASDGTFADRVRVTWAAVTGATSYRVYRNTTNSFGSATLLGTVTGTQNDDFSALGSSAGGGCNQGGSGPTTYFYWVTALTACGESAASTPDQGNAS